MPAARGEAALRSVRAFVAAAPGFARWRATIAPPPAPPSSPRRPLVGASPALARRAFAARPRAAPIPRIAPDDAPRESHGARAERLRRARVRHEVRMAEAQAREELERESWVKRKLAAARRWTQDARFDDDAAEDGRAGAAATLLGSPRRSVSSSSSEDESSSGDDSTPRVSDSTPRVSDVRPSRRRVPPRPRVSDQRCVRVGVVGVPNAGKSQLVNALCGSQISAVSPKTNTTRVETLGQVTRGDAQVVLLDLPGIVGEEHHRNPRHGAKVAGAWAAAAQCDVVLFIVDAFRQVKRPDPRVERLLTEARGAFERARYASVTGLRAPPSVLALNKVDLFAPGDEGRASLKALARRLATLGAFERLFPVSAKLGRGVEGVLEHLLERAPVRPWDLDPDKATDASDAERAIEVVRECVYRRVHQELPYNVVPLHESWERFRDGSAKIEQILVVDSVGAKQILVGRRGSTIGQIGIRARVILEELFGHRVHLVLHVKVRKKNNNSLRGRARTEAFERY